MSLRRKMTLQILAMIAGLLVVGGAALWGLRAVREDYTEAAEGYRQLRQVFEAGSHLATARAMLKSQPPVRADARRQVELADERLDLFIDDPSSKTLAGLPAVRDAMGQAQAQLRRRPENGGDLLDDDEMAVSAALGKIGDLAAGIRGNIEEHQASARHQHAVTTRAVGAVGSAVVLAAVLLGISQYRSVMSPLSALRRGVRQIADGEFSQRLDLRASEEFADLAREFNRMAEQLDGFYHRLEEQVASKSRELVRSERLASVGFLAAGVAHEINNPLGIISGYAELALQQVESAGDGPRADGAAKDLARSLAIICEEAFRCKEITTKLLSLARQGDESRRRLCLPDLVEQVVELVGGLPEYRQRTIAIELPPGIDRQSLCVTAIEAEMKQVLLNLLLNALHATAEGGEVNIALSRDGAWVELAVLDGGRGMSADTLDRVFEPFFTDRRAARPGTGLGLSITHAIVQAHGGAITAASDGPGKGSRFVVRLPAQSSATLVQAE